MTSLVIINATARVCVCACSWHIEREGDQYAWIYTENIHSGLFILRCCKDWGCPAHPSTTVFPLVNLEFPAPRCPEQPERKLKLSLCHEGVWVPNPIKKMTNLWFTHTHPSEVISIHFTVVVDFSLEGKMKQLCGHMIQTSVNGTDHRLGMCCTPSLWCCPVQHFSSCKHHLD